jgi:hypothetical protein
MLKKRRRRKDLTQGMLKGAKVQRRRKTREEYREDKKKSLQNHFMAKSFEEEI